MKHRGHVVAVAAAAAVVVVEVVTDSVLAFLLLLLLLLCAIVLIPPLFAACVGVGRYSERERIARKGSLLKINLGAGRRFVQ